MPDKDRIGILRRLGSSLITPGSFSLIAILIYSALYFSNPYLAPLHVSYFSNGARRAQLHYDTGYRFTGAQKAEFCAIPNSFLQDLDQNFARGPVTLRFEVADKDVNERPICIGKAPEESTVLPEGQATSYRLAPEERLALFEVNDLRKLRSLTASAGDRVTELSLRAAEGWGPTKGALLFDRSEGTARVGVCAYRFDELPPVTFRRLLVRETEPLLPPAGCVAILNSADRVLRVLLAPDGTSAEAASERLDLSAFRLFRHPIKNTVQGLTALLLAAVVVGLGRRAANAYARGELAASLSAQVRVHRIFLLLLTAFLATFGFWLYGLWPGFFNSDSVSAIGQIRSLTFDMWYSCLYPLFVMALMQFGDRYTNLLVFHVLATATLGAAFFSYLIRRGAPLAVVLLFAAVFLCSPVIGASNLYYQRNILNGILNCAIVYFLFRLCFEKCYGAAQEAGCRPVLAFAGVLLFSQILRKDNISILVAAVAVLFLFRVARLRRLSVVAVLLGIGVVLGNGPAERADIGADAHRQRHYLLIPLLNPMGGLLARNYWTPTPQRDSEVISRILDPVIFKRDWIPSEVPYYWNFCATREYTDYDIIQFSNLLFRAACQNPGVFLGQRTELFFMILGGPLHGTIDLDPTSCPRFEKHWRDFGLWRRHFTNERLFKFQLGAIYLTSQLERPFRRLVWNTVPQFLLLLAAVLLYKWLPVTAAVSSVLMARMAMIFVSAPGAYFHYAYDLYLFGFFIIPAALLEWRARRHRIRRIRETTPDPNA